MKTITNTIATAIGSWVATGIKAEQAEAKANVSRTKDLDTMYAEGLRAVDCIAPEKDADRKLYDSLRFAVVTGFSANARRMVEADKAVAKSFKKTDDDTAKADRLMVCDKNRRYWQGQIGSKLKDLKAALMRREEAELKASMSEAELQAEAEAEAKAASDSARLLRDVTAWINRLEKAEATELPVVDCLKHLKALAGIASASA